MNKIYSFFTIAFVLLFVALIIFPQNALAFESPECVNYAYFDTAGAWQEDASRVFGKGSFPACTSIDTGELGFKIPSLGDLLTFAIRAFFVIAGLAALFYLLLGALAWVTSGGDKDAVKREQQDRQ